MPIPAKFPLLNNSNASSIVDIMKYNNTVTNNLFAPVILLVIWAITFMALAYADKAKAFLVSGFLVWVMALMLWGLTLLNGDFMVLLTVINLLSFMYSAYSAAKE